MKWFGTRRSAPILPIDVPTEYGGSYINNAALLEDTNSAIANVLYIVRGLNPANVPVGTVVTVVWADGTTARFKRVSAMGSYQWAYVEGTARNADGDPIDQNGNVLSNPNSSGTGGGEAHNTRNFSSGNYEYAAFGNSRCTTSTTISVNGIRRSTWKGTVPCR